MTSLLFAIHVLCFSFSIHLLRTDIEMTISMGNNLILSKFSKIHVNVCLLHINASPIVKHTGKRILKFVSIQEILSFSKSDLK